MTDKWAEYKKKFCGCKDGSRLNKCKGFSNCELPKNHPEMFEKQSALNPNPEAESHE